MSTLTLPSGTTGFTNGPWHVFSNYKGGIPLSVGSLNSPHGSVTIARVDWLVPRVTDKPSPEAEANAARIVLCVNNFDALKAACKAAEFTLSAMRENDPDVARLVETLRDVLSKI